LKIGIIGSGMVGQALGTKLAALGHDVKIGSRDPQKLTEWAAQAGEKASVGTLAETAEFGEVNVIATKWDGGAIENALRTAGPKNFAGKVVIDVTNPLGFDNGKLELVVGFNDSAGEIVQRLLPDAKVVKALNIVTASVMVNPSSTGDAPDMFIAGDDADAKKTVTDILTAFGWQSVIDLGDITASRYLEPMALVWVIYWGQTQKNGHAFKFVGK